jgi:hypothetical protein
MSLLKLWATKTTSSNTTYMDKEVNPKEILATYLRALVI